MALSAGVIRPVDVIDWADACIAAEAAPHISLIEIALAVNEGVERLGHRLADVPGEADESLAIRIILKALLEQLDGEGADPRQVADHLYTLARRPDWLESEFGTEPYWLDDLFNREPSYRGVFYTEALAAFRAYLTSHAIKVPAQSVRRNAENILGMALRSR